MTDTSRNGGSVAIDGAVLSEDTSALIQKDYKAEEGSTVITLHKKMLNRLHCPPRILQQNPHRPLLYPQPNPSPTRKSAPSWRTNPAPATGPK